VVAADPAGGVVEAAAVSVDEAALGRRDDVPERRDAVSERHTGSLAAGVIAPEPNVDQGTDVTRRDCRSVRPAVEDSEP
jgi:hypothetical protein